VSAIGEYAIDLSILASKGIFSFDATVFSQSTLNAFMALGRSAWTSCRHTLQTLIRNGDEKLKEALVPLSAVNYVMPVSIGDYTDFYASKEHATNVGTMFRGKDNALMPNW
jgi:fumarylacetoacetase